LVFKCESCFYLFAVQEHEADGAAAVAGRFGTRGIAITLVASKEETEILNEVQTRFDVGIEPLPDLSKIDKAIYSNA
jgi:hypothetical protein